MNKHLYTTIIVLWQEERKAADNKIKKLKLHAKAKLTSLNKHIEEMKAQGGTVLPTEPQSEEQLSKVRWLDIIHIFWVEKPPIITDLP